MKKWSQRKWMVVLLSAAVLLLAVVTMLGLVWSEEALATDFSRKNLSPCFRYPFGTDWMGRDMFVRTLTGLSMSVRIGLFTAAVSAVIAFLLGTAAATLGRVVDSVVLWIIDLMMGIPHILLLLLISLACGKGFAGVVIGVSMTHWTSLARVIRGEMLQLRECTYIQIAQRLGMSRWQVAIRHMLPHLLPQFLVGLVLTFPHAILHEASITFLGFGLSPEQPAIGIILSESMKYLAMGKWWLAVFPGICLMLTVMLFDWIGETLRRVLDPGSAHM